MSPNPFIERMFQSELAARFEHDREAYTGAKSECVASVLALA